MATSYVTRADFHDLMIDSSSRSTHEDTTHGPTEAREHHIGCLGLMIVEAHAEIQRRANIAESMRPLAVEG